MLPNPLTPEQDREIRQEIDAGRLIQAIKLYRQVTGLGLKESKDAVEAMRDGQVGPPASGTASAGETATMTRGVFDGAAPATAGSPVPPSSRQEVERLLTEGKKIEAVRAVRQATGLGLKEAKDAADAIESDLRRREPLKFRAADLQKKGGCLGAVLLLLTGIATIVAISATV